MEDPAEAEREFARERRRSWARLLWKLLEVDPLLCPRCGVEMKIVAVTADTKVIDCILAHLEATGGHDPFDARRRRGEAGRFVRAREPAGAVVRPRRSGGASRVAAGPAEAPPGSRLGPSAPARTPPRLPNAASPRHPPDSGACVTVPYRYSRVVNERHLRRRSMIFTTNKDLRVWGKVLHDDLAAAIVDRILERGRILRLDGPSFRTKHLGLDDPAVAELPSSPVATICGTDRPDVPEPTPESPSRPPFAASVPPPSE